MFKKTPSPPPDFDYDSEEEVTIELNEGRSSNEMTDLFRQADAPVPQQIAPRFFSGKVPPALRQALKPIASVHRKTRKQLH
jgi:hypothetical protein